MTSSAAEAVVLEGPRRLGRRSFVVPEVGPDDGLLQVEACGLCGTDHELWGGVLPGPAALDPVVATVFNPLGAGVRWGVTLPGTKEGDVVAVLGPGMRGLSVLAAAKEAGAGFVMVTGAGARDAERLALAEEFGAD